MRGRIAVWEAVIARVNHWLLYAVMLLMPLTGYVLATAAARPSPYFWLFYWPQPAVSAGGGAFRAVGPLHPWANISSTRWSVSMYQPSSGTSSFAEMGLLNECFPSSSDPEIVSTSCRDTAP